MAWPRRTWHEACAVVVAHHEHFAAAGVVAADGLLRHRERIGIDALLDLHAHIHAGQQRQLRIGKLAAQRHLTGAGIDRRVGEQQLAVVGIDLAVVEDEPHPRGRALFKRAGLEFAPQLVELGGRLGEIRIDRIELLDRRDMRRFGLTDQRAFGDERAADAAADRRADPGVFEIELGARDVGLARGDVRLGLADIGDRDVQLRLRRPRRSAPASPCAWRSVFPGSAPRWPFARRLPRRRARSRKAWRRARRERRPLLTSLPCSKLRLTTMPDTRARTSAIRVGAMRPGNSRITASGAGCSSMTLTSWTGGVSGLEAEGASEQADKARAASRTPARKRRAGRVECTAAVGRGGIRVLLISQLRRRVGDKKCSI